MQITSDHRDLERSFEKLKSKLQVANNLVTIGEFELAAQIATNGMSLHIKECTLPETVEAANPDDLKDINI